MAVLVGMGLGCSPAPRAGVADAGGSSSADARDDVDAAPIHGVGCSSDLHSVLDADGNVIGVCPDDQGCADGTCVDACSAATASHGSVGCDFVVATPSFYPGIAPPCFAVFLANNWPESAAVTITREGISYDATTFGRVPDGSPNSASWFAIPATGIASANVGVLFLSSDPTSNNGGAPTTCPVTPAVATANGAAVATGSDSATGIGSSFHITTSFPVSAYDIIPYGGASTLLPSAELLLPTTAWGTNYVAAGPQISTGPGWGQVVAAIDNTIVTITPNVTLPGGPAVATAPANTPTQYTLAAGQYLQWQNAGDMAGSVIQANNPVSYTGGTGYLCLTSATSTGGGCDSSHQQTPPVSALGSQYVASAYATRRHDQQPESIRYRLVGAADGTALTFDPPITGAPTAISTGEVVELETTNSFLITSQDSMHPFFVAQYMSGCKVPEYYITDCLGDEEYVNVLPPAQWLASYVFFTDPTYATTNLVITRKAGNAGFREVMIDCIGVVSGWQPVGSTGEFETTNVDLQRGNVSVGACRNGRHTATSSGAFTITVWGLSETASYAYPAGGNVGKINPVVVIGRQQ